MFVHDNLDSSVLVCDIDGDQKKEMLVGSYDGMLICLKGNADENFVPVLTVESPSNNSVFLEWVTISGSVIDLDDDEEDISIEFKIDDDEWKTLGMGSDFEIKIRIEEASGTERVLRIRATDGKATSNIVSRELVQEVNVSTPSSSIFYLILILVVVVSAVVYLYSRHTKDA